MTREFPPSAMRAISEKYALTASDEAIVRIARRVAEHRAREAAETPAEEAARLEREAYECAAIETGELSPSFPLPEEQ